MTLICTPGLSFVNTSAHEMVLGSNHEFGCLLVIPNKNAARAFKVPLRRYSMVRFLRSLAVPILAATFLCSGVFAQKYLPPWQPSPRHHEMRLWPGPPPDPVTYDGPEYSQWADDPHDRVAGKPWLSDERVSNPTMTVYSPKGKNTGAAVVVFPGGGYQVLAMDLEGTEVCDWLNSRGITCVLVKYRVPGTAKYPKSGGYPQAPQALDDAQRSISLTRQHAAEWHIDPKRIGVIGFSAGGNLVAATSVHFGQRVYKPVDATDAVSCRPDFAIAIYPAISWSRRTVSSCSPTYAITSLARRLPRSFSKMKTTRLMVLNKLCRTTWA